MTNNCIIIIFYYQHPGDVKKPYFIQCSAVWEELPVNVSCIVMKNKDCNKEDAKTTKTNF